MRDKAAARQHRGKGMGHVAGIMHPPCRDRRERPVCPDRYSCLSRKLRYRLGQRQGRDVNVQDRVDVQDRRTDRRLDTRGQQRFNREQRDRCEAPAAARQARVVTPAP